MFAKYILLLCDFVTFNTLNKIIRQFIFFRQVLEVLASLKKEDTVSLGNQIYQNTINVFFKEKDLK